MSVLVVVLAGLLQAGSPDSGDRPQVSLSDFEGLMKNNIFSPEAPPRPVVKVESTPEVKTEAPSGPKALAPVVTGFVFDTASQAYQVVLEDRNALESLRRFSGPRFLTEGEEFLDYRVEKVTANSVTVVYKENSQEYTLGEYLPGGATVPVSGGGTGSGASSLPKVDVADPGVQSILERLKKRNKRD